MVPNTNLTELSLERCGIGSVGGRCLGEYLAHNTSLLFLNLAHNPIGDEGGKAMVEIVINRFLFYHAKNK